MTTEELREALSKYDDNAPVNIIGRTGDRLWCTQDVSVDDSNSGTALGEGGIALVAIEHPLDPEPPRSR